VLAIIVTVLPSIERRLAKGFGFTEAEANECRDEKQCRRLQVEAIDAHHI
jgi:hypothetical protein